MLCLERMGRQRNRTFLENLCERVRKKNKELVKEYKIIQLTEEPDRVLRSSDTLTSIKKHFLVWIFLTFKALNFFFTQKKEIQKKNSHNIKGIFINTPSFQKVIF